MKSRKLISAVSTVMALVLVMISTLTALADQENNFDIPCDHSYALVDFNEGMAVFECSECGDKCKLFFEDYINVKNFVALDVASDGIVNAKDYAKLLQKYKNGIDL